MLWLLWAGGVGEFHGSGEELDGQCGHDFDVADTPGEGFGDAGDGGCVDGGALADEE